MNNEMTEMGRLLIVAGAIVILAGLAFAGFGKLGLGKLPGDIVLRRGNVRLYIPLVSSLLISLGLSLIFWLLQKR